MIITVTANPSIDKTAALPRFEVGGLNRLDALRSDLAGKGVNVARVAKTLGAQVLAAGLLGREGGAAFTQGLEADGIGHDFVPVNGAVRVNLKVVEENGRLTELNEPGIPYTEADGAALEAILLLRAGPGDVAVLCGSLPTKAPTNSYRRWCEKLKRQGAAVLVDADGPALAEALNVPPNIIKPNRYELLQYFGLQHSRAASLPQLRALCGKLVARGVETVALSLGGEGALFVNAQACCFAPGLAVKVASPVGAGDSMVAALAVARQKGLQLDAAATLAMACAAAAVATPGTAAPSAALIEQMRGQVKLQRLE